MRRTNIQTLLNFTPSFSRRGQGAVISVLACLLAAALAFTLASCRTSQQEARRNANAHAQLAHGQATLGHEVDSLLLVQSKLVEVIDSMTGLVDADHARIRALEREVDLLRARRSTAALPPSGAAQPPSYGSMYVAPPALPFPPLITIPPPPNDRSSEQPTPGNTNAASLQDRYAAALRLFNDNSFSSALTAFHSLEIDDPNGPLASNYKYWQGECYYALKQYNQALQTFSGVVADYPHTTKAAASQFKIAESYEQLNLIPSARSSYQKLLDNYPTSEFSARARARLVALR